MRVAVFGAGATGARIARKLATSAEVEQVSVHDPDQQRLEWVVSSLGPTAAAAESPAFDEGEADAVVVATPSGTQLDIAAQAVDAGATVVTTTADPGETRALLALDRRARSRRSAVVVGAGYMPGLSCLLARFAAAELDQVDEIHVAKAGTGGPACARQHHRSLSGMAVDWRDGEWIRRPGGSGRELCWFPDPVSGRDCYRAALPDALLLAPAFPGVSRVTARLAATRRDRFTAPLPMLRPPHPEGGVGAVRVEIRGRLGPERKVVVLGSCAQPAAAASAVAAAAVLHARACRSEPGARGLAAIEQPRVLLAALSDQGLRPSRFEGFATFT